jgi:hypothetical protein
LAAVGVVLQFFWLFLVVFGGRLGAIVAVLVVVVVVVSIASASFLAAGCVWY